MIVAKVQVSGSRCTPVQLETITKGIVGATVSIEYTDSVWDNLQKTVVFRGAVTKDVLNAGNEVIIPAEAVSRAGTQLYMGVYGVDGKNNVVIPTIWASLGTVQGAAAPSGDSSTDPSLPVWAQIQAMIGNLDELDTAAKGNLVAAVNETLLSGGGSGGETWELIKSITIPEGAEEANALTISTDEAGLPFSLKKAKIFGCFPKYTGISTVPNFSFFVLNGVASGANAPYCYTGGLVKPSTTMGNTCSVEVDLTLPGIQRELVFWNTNGGKEYFGAAKIIAVTSIGGTNMLIYPGCKFWLYGVRS